MTANPAMAPPAALRMAAGAVLAAWMLAAAFPLAWIALMSVRLPVDAFSGQPWRVLLGPGTRAAAAGPGALDIAVAAACAWLAWRTGRRLPARLSVLLPYAVAVALAAVVLLPPALRMLDGAVAAVPGLDVLAAPVLGFTGEHYRAVWLDHGFHRNFLNSLLVTAGVVALSLSAGTLAGYALARTPSRLAFALLILALVFRALPQSVLVAGYLPVFVDSARWLRPLWDAPVLGGLLHLAAPAPPTLYGRPWAVIFVLVSINQPFTIWMLRSFFRGIPAELDEAARVDGCSTLGAFWRVIMPVMWPGVITAGLFSFLLAYNDYLVCALLLDAQSQTMVPAITGFFNRETTATDEVEAIAAAVSVTAPLFLLVLAFQRQIVSGLTAGAVKG